MGMQAAARRKDVIQASEAVGWRRGVAWWGRGGGDASSRRALMSFRQAPAFVHLPAWRRGVPRGLLVECWLPSRLPVAVSGCQGLTGLTNCLAPPAPPASLPLAACRCLR